MSKTLTGLFLGALFQLSALAQSNWPKEIILETRGRIVLYQLQPETLTGNQLTARAAISVRRQAEAEPVFGAIWLKAILNTDKSQHQAILENIHITTVRFPPAEDDTQDSDLAPLLERELPKQKLEISLDELMSALEAHRMSGKAVFDNTPPELIYTQQPTTLVRIDGQPFIQFDEELAVNRVQNTPFIVLQDPSDKLFYLYANRYWYQSASILSGWMPVGKLPRSIRKANRNLRNPASEDEDQPMLPPVIVVRTNPAELIQTEGQAQLAPIENTKLLYVTNTNDPIFLDITSQQYYVVLAGRWYKAPQLTGPWAYVYSESLPADFARIPEGSKAAAVLTYVPGTEAAREAAMDAQTPQAARVDRKRAVCQVSYDGDPQFEPVTGTNLYLAVNASGTVLRAGNRYYCVENGVWFTANQATGPWTVATERPADVDRIPPGNPAYPVRYVYIYDVNPDFVYMGYTAGYLGCYVYGPTIVYGTGYAYPAWYGRAYYPRPVTWGFGMHYDPWTGWSLGFNVGWFHLIGPRPRYWSWWGPTLYRPAYRPRYRPYIRREAITGNYDYPDRRSRSNPTISRGPTTDNLYRYRNDVLTSRGTGNNGGDLSNSYRPSPKFSDLFRKGRISGKEDDVYPNRAGNRPPVDQQDSKPTNRRNSPSLSRSQREFNPDNRSTNRDNPSQRSNESRTYKPAPSVKRRGPQ